MTVIQCAWIVNTPESIRQLYPDANALHRPHAIGVDMGQCDSWHCVCGNEPQTDGFTPCDSTGADVEPGESWVGPHELLRCGGCGRIYHSDGTLIKVYEPPELRAALTALDEAGGYTMVKPAGRRALNCYAIPADVWERARALLNIEVKKES